MLKRLTSLAVPILVLALLIHEVLNTPFYSERELAAMRERNVALAKNGQYDEALNALRALTEIVPKDGSVWSDYLSVMIWSGRDAEAIALARGGNVPKLRDYALLALFEAALRRGDADGARYFAQTEIVDSDKPETVTTARAWALYDANLLPQAQAVAATGLRRLPTSAKLLAIQPLLLSKPDSVQPAPQAQPPVPPAPAPEVSNTARAQARAVPVAVAAVDDAPAERERPAPRRSVKGPAQPRPRPAPGSGWPQAPVTDESTVAAPAAQAPAAAEPHTIRSGPWERRELAAQRAQNAVRSIEDAPISRRRALADEALVALDQYAAVLAADFPDDAEARRNEQLDRVRALTFAGRLDAAAAVFEALGDPAGFPVYGLLNGAEVYSQRRQPERAEALIQMAAAKAPEDSSVLGAQFYNQIDRERYAQAASTLEQLQRLQGDVPAGRVVWTDRLAAMFEAYQNRLGRAQKRLEALRAKAPKDAAVRLNLATVYRWRGWSQRALDEYRAAHQSGADPMPVRAGAARALLDAHRFGEAQTKLESLKEEVPDYSETVALDRDWSWHDRNEYSAQLLAGKSSGSPVTGNGDITFEQWLRSRPFAENYRAFAHQRYDWADFPGSEGTGDSNRVGLGVDYRSGPFDAALEVTDRTPGGKLGLTFSGEWRIDDRMAIFGDAQTDSTLVPLRGLHSGLDGGESGSLGFRYRWNESQEFRTALSSAHFSDGNHRQQASASYTQTVWQNAHHQIALSGQAYYSHNDGGDDVFYYNPENDGSAGLNLQYTGILSRRFDRVWSQRLAVGTAGYWQQDHGTSPIWDVEYEQRWQIGPALTLNLGGLYRSRVYDGGREGYGAVFGGINWRF